MAVYFELVDAVGHLFMPYAPPRREGIPKEKYEMFKGAVEASYVYQDRILGRIMDRCDENTVLVVLSDHGFKSGENRLRGTAQIRGGKAALWHRLQGIIAFYGPGTKRGVRLERASIKDIAPTVLALMGLPKAEDMPGKILKDAFEADLASHLGRNTVATLEGGGVEREKAGASRASSRQELKKLEALGYITPENPAAHNNLGQRYQKSGRYQEAVEEYKKALAINPNYPEALNNLGICYGKLRRYREAEQAFLKALSLKKDDVLAMNNLALSYMEQNRLDDALALSLLHI